MEKLFSREEGGEQERRRKKGLIAEYPTTLKQPLKIGGYVDTQSLRIRVSTLIVNIF